MEEWKPATRIKGKADLIEAMGTRTPENPPVVLNVDITSTDLIKLRGMTGNGTRKVLEVKVSKILHDYIKETEKKDIEARIQRSLMEHNLIT